MTKQELSSKIIENEMTLQKALNEGHKPHTADEYQPLRVENEILRCMLFGEDSPNCRRVYTKKKGTK